MKRHLTFHQHETEIQFSGELLLYVSSLKTSFSCGVFFFCIFLQINKNQTTKSLFLSSPAFFLILRGLFVVASNNIIVFSSESVISGNVNICGPDVCIFPNKPFFFFFFIRSQMTDVGWKHAGRTIHFYHRCLRKIYRVCVFTSPNELRRRRRTWKQTRRAVIPNKSKIRRLCFVFFLINLACWDQRTTSCAE